MYGRIAIKAASEGMRFFARKVEKEAVKPLEQEITKTIEKGAEQAEKRSRWGERQSMEVIIDTPSGNLIDPNKALRPGEESKWLDDIKRAHAECSHEANQPRYTFGRY